MIKDIETALKIFETAAKKQGEATEIGDYKTGNKCYYEIIKAIAFLKSQNAISFLQNYLDNPSVGVRLWAACYWLPINEQEGLSVLVKIAQCPGIHSLDALTTISEWKKGNLNF